MNNDFEGNVYITTIGDSAFEGCENIGGIF